MNKHPKLFLKFINPCFVVGVDGKLFGNLLNKTEGKMVNLSEYEYYGETPTLYDILNLTPFKYKLYKKDNQIFKMR